MTAQVNNGTSYTIVNVKGGTLLDLSAGDNKTGEAAFLVL